MNTKETKIHFYSILKRLYKSKDQDENEEVYYNEIFEIFRKLSNKSKKKRSYDLKGDKFCLLGNLKSEDGICYGYIKSARNEFRPNLIDRRTLKERNNPKEKSEGDVEKTHFLIKEENGEVILFLEHNHSGITINNFINYLQNFAKSIDGAEGKSTGYKIIFSVIANNDFLKELEFMQRAKVAEIYMDKQLLGNEALNFSEKIIQNSM